MESANLAPEMLEEMVGIIAEICKKSSAKITKDWLLDNVELPTLISFISFVFAPVTERMKALGIEQGQGQGQGEGEPGKN